MHVRRFSSVLLFSFFFLASPAFAATSELRLLLDVDRDASTGCTAFAMRGAEQVVTTVVVHAERTFNGPLSVTSVFGAIAGNGVPGGNGSVAFTSSSNTINVTGNAGGSSSGPAVSLTNMVITAGGMKFQTLNAFSDQGLVLANITGPGAVNLAGGTITHRGGCVSLTNVTATVTSGVTCVP